MTVQGQIIERAAEQLSRLVDDVAARTGALLEVRRDAQTSCQLSGRSTSRRHDYSVAVRTRLDTEQALGEDVIPSLLLDGWELVSQPAEAPRYRLRRDGFSLTWLFARSGERVAVVRGTTPCFPVGSGISGA